MKRATWANREKFMVTVRKEASWQTLEMQYNITATHVYCGTVQKCNSTE